MSVWLSCGSVDSLRLDTLHGFNQDFDSAACLQPQPQPLHPPTIVFLSSETHILASLVKHETQAFILALAAFETPDVIQAVLIKSSK